MPRFPRVALGVAAGVAALLAACGSSSTSSTSSGGAASSSSSSTSSGSVSTSSSAAATVDAAYAAAAAQICTTAEAQVASTPVPGDPTKATAADMPKWATFLDKVVALHGQALQQLAALPPPASGQAALQAAGGLALKIQTDLQTVATAAHAGDLNAFATSFALYNQDNTQANAAYDALGIKACGSGTSNATATATTS
jgi:hypothetical protein